MIEAVLMYGSRARGDSAADSDTDLLGITTEDRVRKTFDERGLSFHAYPLFWMNERAEGGNLFIYHIVSEAIPIFDPLSLLDQVRHNFKLKVSYRDEIELGARIVAATLGIPPEDFNEVIRRRYFWGLRTMLMAAAADRGAAAFAATSIEDLFSIPGLADHIHTRRIADYAQCSAMGRSAIGTVGGVAAEALAGSHTENLRFLLDTGGIATATAAEIIYGF